MMICRLAHAASALRAESFDQFTLQSIQLTERITLVQLFASLLGMLGLLNAFGIVAKQVRLSPLA